MSVISQIKRITIYQKKAFVAQQQMAVINDSTSLCHNCKVRELRNLRDTIEFNVEEASNILDNCDFSSSPIYTILEYSNNGILAALQFYF